jgi:hypothetical protein
LTGDAANELEEQRVRGMIMEYSLYILLDSDLEFGKLEPLKYVHMTISLKK